MTPFIWIPVLEGLDSYSAVRDQWNLWELMEACRLVSWRREQERRELERERKG